MAILWEMNVVDVGDKMKLFEIIVVYKEQGKPAKKVCGECRGFRPLKKVIVPYMKYGDKPVEVNLCVSCIKRTGYVVGLK